MDVQGVPWCFTAYLHWLPAGNKCCCTRIELGCPAMQRPGNMMRQWGSFRLIGLLSFSLPCQLCWFLLSLLLEFLKVRATYRSCHPSTWSDGCCSLLAAFSDWFVWVYLAGVGSSLFSANYVRNPRIGSCVCRTVDHRTDFKGFWDNVSNFRNTLEISWNLWSCLVAAMLRW